MVELFDLNNNKYYILNFNEFFNIDGEDYYFPYEYALYELNKANSYLMVLIPKINIDEDIVDLSFIKKFNFKSFDKETYEEINSVKYEKYLNSKIMNTFLWMIIIL